MCCLCTTGNDCIFSGNFLHDLCFEVTDSGAFYSGRSWISGGNIVANNVFMNIVTTEKVYLGSPSVQAIYLDDQVLLIGYNRMVWAWDDEVQQHSANAHTTIMMFSNYGR